MRAAADRYAICIPGDEPNGVDRNAEPFVDELRKAGLVTLPVRDGSDDDLHDLVRQHRYFGALARCPSCGIDVVGDADATVFATFSGFCSAGRETAPVAQSDHALHDLMIGATVVDHAKWI